ncbi:MAG: hypothetical protein RMM58_00620 [Chloroflexota bacterium]|nr:hypothetical protein [Chloroflexota bacterium]
MRPLVALLFIAALAGCHPLGAAPAWVRDDAGLPRYAMATGLAVGPDETVYVALYREEGVAVRRAGDSWHTAADLRGVAAYGVAAAPQPGTALAATVDGVYRTEDGGRQWRRTSSRSPIYAVHFDPDGTAWAGGEGEVLRSPDGGQSWSVVARFDPLVTVLSLARGRAGLVIATAGSGIHLLHDGRLQHVSPLPQVVSSVAADSAGRLAARSEGRLWISATGEVWEPGPPLPRPVVAVGAGAGALLAATEGAGVFQSRDGGTTWTPVGGALSATVYAAAGRTRVWAVTAHGVLAAGADGWERSGEGVGRPLVRGLAADGGTLLAATSDGVYRREAEGWRPLSGDLRETFTLFVLPAGDTLFAGTFERGILRSVTGGRTWEPVTEAEYRRAIIPAIAAGGDTLIARVEYDRTLQSRDRGATWALADAGLAGRTVFAVASDGRAFWAGTDEGVYRLDDTVWRALPPLSGTVSALLPTTEGLVAGTSDGLWRWDGSAWRRSGLDERHVVALLAGADGRVEIAATSSDGVFQRVGLGWRALGLAGERINAVARDPRDGALVVATDSGVWRTR